MQIDLGDRSKYIGGSDVNIIFGVSEFTKRQELLRDKLNVEKIAFESNAITEFGHNYEDELLDIVETDYNLKLNRQTEFVFTGLGFPIICHLDGYDELDENCEGVVVEAKTTSTDKFDNDWAFGCPDYYKPQTHTYCFVSGAKRIITVVGERIPTTAEDRDDYFDKLCQQGIDPEEAALRASQYIYKLGRIKTFDNRYNEEYFSDVLTSIEEFIVDLKNGYNIIKEGTVKEYLKLKKEIKKASDKIKKIEEEVFSGDKKIALSKNYQFNKSVFYTQRFNTNLFKKEQFEEYSKYLSKSKSSKTTLRERKK